MSLQGSFVTFKLPEIFQMLAVQQISGVLTVIGGSTRTSVHFLEGRITYASESRVKAQNMLGRILLRSGLISMQDLTGVLAAQREKKKRFGEILLERKLIDADVLKDLLLTQAKQRIYELLGLERGEYDFDPSVNVQREEDSFEPLAVEQLLLEGASIIDEWKVISTRITSFNTVYKVNKEEFNPWIEKMAYQQSRIFEQIDGVKTVRDIIYQTLLPEFDVCKALYRFLEAGFIEEDHAATQKHKFNVDLVNPFLEAIIESIEMMCDLPVTAGSIRKKRLLELAHGEVSGIIRMRGEKQASFALTFTKPLLLKLIHSMFDMDKAYIDSQVRDAVMQLTQIIAGVGAERLAESGIKMSPSVAHIIAGERHYIEHPIKGHVILAPFVTKYGAFCAEICLGK